MMSVGADYTIILSHLFSPVKPKYALFHCDFPKFPKAVLRVLRIYPNSKWLIGLPFSLNKKLYTASHGPCDRLDLVMLQGNLWGNPNDRISRYDTTFCTFLSVMNVLFSSKLFIYLFIFFFYCSNPL